MDEQTMMQEMLILRENMYRFLSRLYLLEVDGPLLAKLRVMDFPTDCGNTELDEGYRMLEKALAALSNGDLDELAADYARVFLAAGVAEGGGAFPYESVYTSRSRSVRADARGQVAAAYRAEGVTLVEEMPGVPEDHIAVELDFMASLCGSALIEPEYLEKQIFFAKDHILNWVPRFAQDVGKYAGTDFYRALGKITAGFLQMEGQYLNEVKGALRWAT